jgi:5-methylcytosine-specific restriction endonuclease McrA
MASVTQQILLLNADYSYINSVSWQKAICLVVKGKVEVLKYSKRVIQNFDGSVVMKIPAVMKLVKIIRTLYRTRVPFSKRNILIRDSFICGYCGIKSKKMTIDHIIPRSKGGKSTFENCVASCKKCNSKKGSKTPREAKMFLRIKPTQPTIYEFMNIKLKTLGINEILKDLGVF